MPEAVRYGITTGYRYGIAVNGTQQDIVMSVMPSSLENISTHIHNVSVW